MNKQGKLVNGKVVGGIEWTKTFLPDGTERQGYTWNPIGGCQHACRWTMPDNSTAICYAESQVDRMKSDTFYPQGFEHHYWNPGILDEPQGVKEPSKVFCGSMSDVFGRWVSDEQIQRVLEACAKAPQHQFQMLTKNAPRLLHFDFPDNVWVGVSVPPSFMMGKQLSEHQQRRMVEKQLATLDTINASVKFMSVEPLSFNVAAEFHDFMSSHSTPFPLSWMIIGAASNGAKKYQPKREWTEWLLRFADLNNIPIFMKGNLDWTPHREEFPVVAKNATPQVQEQQSLFP